MSDTNTVLLGPLPYNRFLGNPPVGMTPEDAFKAEMGYEWLVQVNAQPFLDKINQLETKNNELQAQVDKLKVEVIQAQQTQQLQQTQSHISSKHNKG